MSAFCKPNNERRQSEGNMFDQLMRQAIREEMRAALREVAEAGQGTAPADRFLSVQEAASIASVSEATVREWVKRGDLNGYRAGKLIRVAHAELIQMLRRDSSGKPVEKEPDTGTQMNRILARRRK